MGDGNEVERERLRGGVDAEAGVRRGQERGLSGHDGDAVNGSLPSSFMRAGVKSSELADEPAIGMIMLGRKVRIGMNW